MGHLNRWLAEERRINALVWWGFTDRLYVKVSNLRSRAWNRMVEELVKNEQSHVRQ